MIQRINYLHIYYFKLFLQQIFYRDKILFFDFFVEKDLMIKVWCKSRRIFERFRVIE